MLMKEYIKLNQYVKAKPQWCCLDIIDVFGAQFIFYYYMLERQNQKFDLLEEEGNSSHVYTSCDNLVAHKDKLEAGS